jgi:uncharacterized protein (TIGR02246 family)
MTLMHILACVGCTMGAVAALYGGGTGQARLDESAIRELEERLARAWVERDRAFIETLLAPEWTVTDAAGQMLTKQQVLDEAFSSGERRIESMAIDEVRVRIYENTAVVTGRTRATGSYRGERGSATLRFTDVFVKRDGRWQVVASQGTLVPSG